MTRDEAITAMINSVRPWDRLTGEMMRDDPKLGHLDARRLAAHKIQGK